MVKPSSVVSQEFSVDGAFLFISSSSRGYFKMIVKEEKKIHEPTQRELKRDLCRKDISKMFLQLESS